MKERPIIFNTEMVKAILDGRKTMTRRVIKPCSKATLADGSQPEWVFTTAKCPYGQVGDLLWCKQNYLLLNEDLLPPDTDILYRLTDDRIYAILTMEVQNGRYKTDEWSPAQAYPNLPQRGLHGGVGWSNLLTNKVQRLWAEGIRGMVSAARTQQRQRLSNNIYVPPESQSIKECSPPDMYGFSWDAAIPIISNTAFRRQSGKQYTRKSEMGYSTRKLDGQEGARTRERGRQTPNGKAIELRDEGDKMGNREGAGQPASNSEDSWDVAGWNLRSCPQEVLRLKPSMFMFKKDARIWTEITGLRAERVQEISEADALAEGMLIQELPYDIAPYWQFKDLWDSINAKRGYGWEANPWVWVISFKRVE